MEQFDNIEAVLKRAIQLEVEAMTLYSNAAQSVKDDAVRQRLEEMAEQERGHKAKLEDILAGNVRWAIRRSKSEPVTDLRLSDHLGAVARTQCRLPGCVALCGPAGEGGARFLQGHGRDGRRQAHPERVRDAGPEELRHKYVLEKTYEEVVYKDF